MKKETLSNKVAKEIIAKIASGVYKKGGKLPPERKLAVEFKVSRLSLREALAKLQTLGVLKIRHGSGATVNNFKDLSLPEELMPDFAGVDSELLEEIIVARKAIERVSVTLASRNRTDNDIERISRSLEEKKEYIDNIEKSVQADMAFHRNIATASKNRVLLKLMDSITEYQKYSQILTAYLANEDERTAESHERILKAIIEQDETAAEKAIDEHLNSMKTYLKENKSSIDEADNSGIFRSRNDK